MKRDSLLVVGLGQCGCALADLLRCVNHRYSTLYINSSLGDIKGLKFADIDSNVFIFSGVDGAGRSRKKAKTFFESDKIRLASFIKNFSQFKYMLIFTSFGGGTGSGTFPEFVDICKTVMPSIVINVVGVLPSLKENKLELKNTIECLTEMNKISKLLNDVKYINNDNGNSYKEINERAVRDIDLAYGMTVHSEIGSIDENNLTNVTTCKGYGVILRLKSNPGNLSASIEDAVRESVFELPSSLKGVYGAINVPKTYSVDEMRDCVETKETLYMGYGSKNVICIGGCSFPNKCMDDIESTLKEKEMRNSDYEDIGFSFKPKYSTDVAVDAEKQTKQNRTFMNDDDIDKLFNEDNYDF